MSAHHDMPRRRPGRPATGQTPIRSVRVPEDVWQAAMAVADADGTTVSAWIVEDLNRRLKRRTMHRVYGA